MHGHHHGKHRHGMHHDLHQGLHAGGPPPPPPPPPAHHGRFRGPFHGPPHHHVDLDGLPPAKAKVVLKLETIHAKQRLLTLELQRVRRLAHGPDGDKAARKQAAVLDRLQKLTIRQADLANRVQDLHLHHAAHLKGPKRGHKPGRCASGRGRGGHRHHYGHHHGHHHGHHGHHGHRGHHGHGWKAQAAALLQALPDNAKVVLIDGRFLERVGLDQATIDAFFAALPTDHAIVRRAGNRDPGAAEGKGKACVGRRILTHVAEAVATKGEGPVVVVSAKPHLLRKAQACGAAIMGPQVFKQLVDPTTSTSSSSSASSSSSSESESEEDEALGTALEQVHLDNDEPEFPPLGEAFVELGPDCQHDQDIAMALAQIHDHESAN